MILEKNTFAACWWKRKIQNFKNLNFKNKITEFKIRPFVRNKGSLKILL